MQNRNGYGQAGRVKGYVEFHREPSSRSQTRPSSEVKSNRNRSIKTMKKIYYCIFNYLIGRHFALNLLMNT